MNNRHRIAIVGAGVAGMALAILATRKGYQVCLYERDSEVSSMGAGVTLWPNAIFVLQQLGLAREIERLGGAPRFMRQFDQAGVRNAELDIEAVNALSGFPSVTILRRDLMTVLADTLDELGIERHFGCSMTAADIGRLKQAFDLVVGADGRMNSVVRQTLFADPVRPSYQGFINIIGISHREEGVRENAVQDFRGQGERFGIVPVQAGTCYWAAAWRTPMDKARPLSAWYDELDERFRYWPPAVKAVLRCREPTSLNRIFVHDLDPLPYWHRDNVLIVGDAAHAPLPTSGQGACQALEDAWHLCRCLQENTSLGGALTNFYRCRIDKVTAAQTVGRQLAQRLFADYAEPRDSAPAISAEQLSQFWMQGLAVD
ncbi:MAG: FAD-dependent monooxygenase [Alcanivorax sp.]|nr:FAD-dependent monooxygenase [Alcanivorax sp.]